MRILVIEDNSDIAANLGDYLEDRGHTVDFAADGVTGLHLAVVHDFDAIVLDLNLPGMDGIEVCRKLRNEARKQTPVLMLTARDSLENKLAGFDSGADDYLIKPFALQEVEVRLNALSRRGKGVQTRVLDVGDLEYNLDTLEVRVELTAETFSDDIRTLEMLHKRIGAAIFEITGVHAAVTLVKPHTLPRSEGKLNRVQDNRKKSAGG